MARWRVSRDLKMRIPYLYYTEKLPVKKIKRYLGVQKSLVYRCLKFYREYGVPYDPYASIKPQGRPRLLLEPELQMLKTFLQHRPCMYLDELTLFEVVLQIEIHTFDEE